jgi:RNA polymerase primary sigma factor
MNRLHASECDLVAASQAREPGGQEALVESFLPLIASVARIYRGSPTVERSELMQSGVLGLLRALERYDPDLGTPFWAYASWWVREAMQQLVSELERPVVLSDRALRHLARVRDAHREHLQRHGREPSCAELASGAGLAREQVERLIAAERRPRGLEETVGGDADGGSTFGDLVVDPAAEDAYDSVPSRIQAGQLRPLLDELDEREHWIVNERFGLNGPARTLRELARVLGVSAERVRQVEQVALDKLRAAVARRSLDGRGSGPTTGRGTRSAPNHQRRQRDDDDHRAVRAVASRPQPSLHRRGGGRWVRAAG